MAEKKKKTRKKSSSGSARAALIFLGLAAIVAMPTTIMVFFAMFPTLAAFFVDRTSAKTRVLSVGAMNLAGASPFILQLWTTTHTIDMAFSIITDPRTIIVIYSAAGMGYLIDWAISGLISTIMVEHSNSRKEQIGRIQSEMVERWGREVTGEIPLDPMGFPLKPDGSQR